MEVERVEKAYAIYGENAIFSNWTGFETFASLDSYHTKDLRGLTPPA